MVIMYDIQGKPSGEVSLPIIFSSAYRPDVIKRAVLAQQSAMRQAYGSDVLGGKRTSAHYHGRRRIDSRMQMMNREMARMPRVHGKSAAWQAWRARFVPQAKGGREAHPPKPEKNWVQKVNDKELKLAIRSAIAACTVPELVKLRGHRFVSSLPVVFADEFESIKKTKDVISIFSKLGLAAELERTKNRKVRAGRGKMRGRRYYVKKGVLFVASKECSVIAAVRNISGSDAVQASDLTVEHLAPGCQAGRLAVFTKSALDAVQKRFGD
jgi:large subunit ribosomal protein L4e